MNEETVALIVLAVTAIATAVTAIANVILQVFAKIEAARVTVLAQEDAKKVQKTTEEVKLATQQTTAETKKVKNILTETSNQINEKLSDLRTTTDIVHTLTNSNMGIQLRMNAELSRWKADQGDNEEYIRDAEIAEKLCREHDLRQKQVDEKKNE